MPASAPERRGEPLRIGAPLAALALAAAFLAALGDAYALRLVPGICAMVAAFVLAMGWR